MMVVIMAGGKGTRIASVNSEVPKPMIEIGGKPILQWQIENLKACGLTDIILVVGYMGNIIQDYFKDGTSFGVHISYFVESTPLGTAGALFKMPQLTEDFLLMCGDVILDVDFKRFIEFHYKNKAWASLMAHPNGHPYDSSLLVTKVLPPQEAGGLRFRELLDAVRDVFARFNVVAFDNVELSPPIDPSGRSTALACKFLREELLAVRPQMMQLC